jgi:peroxiredoxin
MLDVGDPAPEFVLPGTDGDEIRPYRLDDHTDEGVVVLLFYPFDFSPVCTAELCEIRDLEWLLFTDGVDVFGVSTDSVYAHRAFIDAYDLPFPLLSDNSAAVSERYGVRYDEWEDHEQVSKRAFLVVDHTETVRYAWHTENAAEQFDIGVLQDATETVDAFPATA